MSQSSTCALGIIFCSNFQAPALEFNPCWPNVDRLRPKSDKCLPDLANASIRIGRRRSNFVAGARNLLQKSSWERVSTIACAFPQLARRRVIWRAFFEHVLRDARRARGRRIFQRLLCTCATWSRLRGVGVVLSATLACWSARQAFRNEGRTNSWNARRLYRVCGIAQ